MSKAEHAQRSIARKIVRESLVTAFVDYASRIGAVTLDSPAVQV
jgi:hypothetical protein